MTRMSRGRAARRLAMAAAGVLALGATTASAAAGAGGGGPEPKHKTWVVKAGGSIQAAVTKAASGDTIRIEAGTYREAVCIDGKGLRVVGAGRGKTVIAWPEWSTIAQLPAVTSTPCWTSQERADNEGDPSTLKDDVSALFFLNPKGPVSVSGLTTKNHPSSGVITWGAKGFDVHGVEGVGHERYGIIAAASTRIAIIGNVLKGVTRPAPVYSGTAGVSVGDSDGARATVAGNKIAGYNLGIFLRESRGGLVGGNAIRDTCTGILVFDDSATEIPDTTRHVVGGDWRVVGNSSTANTRYCLAGRDGSQRVSGVGAAVVNADKVLVTGNSITGNRPQVPSGQLPINFPPAGLVLLGFAPPPGTSPPGAVAPGTVENVTVTGNRITGNQPVDIWLTRPIPQNPLILAPGPKIVVKGNICGVGDPASLCPPAPTPAPAPAPTAP